MSNFNNSWVAKAEGEEVCSLGPICLANCELAGKKRKSRYSVTALGDTPQVALALLGAEVPREMLSENVQHQVLNPVDARSNNLQCNISMAGVTRTVVNSSTAEKFLVQRDGTLKKLAK